jgi:DNA primase
MKTLDPQISEICRRVKIVDYLRQKGVNLIKGGNRWRCLCPFPDHKDHDPSFYIRTAPDGAEIFKCFGCGKSGNILSLISGIEGESKGKVVKK